MSIVDAAHRSHGIVCSCKTFSVLCQNCRNLITELCWICLLQTVRVIITNCDRSCLIDCFDVALHVLCVLLVLALTSLWNTEVQLISDIPDDNGRIVLITFNIGFQNKFVPGIACRCTKQLVVCTDGLVEVCAEVLAVAVFRECPSVKRLIHNHHTQLVACFKQYRRRCVVRGTDRITSHFFELFNLTVYCITF